MATREELYTALRNADAAGDTEGARRLADYIKTLPAAAPVAVVTPDKSLMEGVPGNFGENFAAGAGQAALGLKQNLLDRPAQWLSDHFPVLDKLAKATGTPTAKEASAVTQQMIDAGRPYDNKLLMRTAGGFTGNAAANALAAYGVGRFMGGIPGGPTAGGAIAKLSPSAAKYGSAAAVGAGVGALQPTATGENSAGHIVGGAVGGVLGQGVGDIVGKAASAVTNMVKAGSSITQAANVLNGILSNMGLSRADIEPVAAKAFDEEVKKAIKAGGVLDADALRRKAAFLVVGAQPTLGKITRDPQQYALEHTLTGLRGAGSELAQIEAGNNRILIESLNKAGAAKSNLSFDNGGDYAAGSAIHEPLSKMVDSAKSHVGELYKAAEDLHGRPIPMDHVAFTQLAGDYVDKTGKNYFLPDEFKSILNDLASGKYPLTVGTAEQLKTALASATRGAKDGNVRAALGAVRQALEETPIMGQAAKVQPGTAMSISGTLRPTEPTVGQEAIDAFNRARAANRTMMQTVESTPSIKDVFEGMQPDDFFKKHVIGAKVADLKKTADFLKQNPADFEQVKSDIVGWLKNKALNGGTDETGSFSQAAFNKAINAFGRDKMLTFFSPQEVAKMQTLAKVATYIQKAPAGSRVNASNTASAGANLAGMAMKGNALTDLAKRAAMATTNNYKASKAVGAKVPVTILDQPSAAGNKLLQYLGAGMGASM